MAETYDSYDVQSIDIENKINIGLDALNKLQIINNSEEIQGEIQKVIKEILSIKTFFENNKNFHKNTEVGNLCFNEVYYRYKKEIQEKVMLIGEIEGLNFSPDFKFSEYETFGGNKLEFGNGFDIFSRGELMDINYIKKEIKLNAAHHLPDSFLYYFVFLVDKGLLQEGIDFEYLEGETFDNYKEYLLPLSKIREIRIASSRVFN